MKNLNRSIMKDGCHKNREGFSLESRRAYDASNREAVEFFASRPGREVVTIAPAEWEKIDKVLAPVFDKWIADTESQGRPAKNAPAEAREKGGMAVV